MGWVEYTKMAIVCQGNLSTRSWVCLGAFSAGIRGVFRVEVERGRFPSILALEAGTQSLRIKEQPHQRGKSLPPKLARPLCETSKSCGHGLNPLCVGPCFPYPFSQTGAPLLHPRYQASSLLWVPPTSVSLRPLPRFLHLSENALTFPAPTDGSPWLPHGLHVRLDAA